MAKKTRLDQFLEDADKLKGAPKGKRGVYTLDDIEKDIADEELREVVKARYNAYLNGIQEFKEVRLRLMWLKTDLQNVLDRPFVNGGLISQSAKWSLSVDTETYAIIYQDDDKSYLERYDNAVKRSEGNKPVGTP